MYVRLSLHLSIHLSVCLSDRLSVCLSQGGQVVDKVNGAHVPEFTKKIAAHSQTPALSPPSQTEPHSTPTKEV